MKIRLLKIFLISFIIIFALLNGRFLYANISYLASSGSLPPSKISNSDKPAVVGNKKNKTVPDKATLYVEHLGIVAPIIFNVAADQNSIYQNLENGVVHYSNSPKPGMEGVSLILGHSSAYPWYQGQYGSVFALIGKLSPGETFYIKYEDGQTFTYRIKQSVVFSPFSNDERLTEIEKAPGSTLVLISCWPIGTNYKRIAIQAELI